MYLRNISNRNYTDAKLFDPSAYGGNLPESIDWRNNGAVSSVKNQVQDHNLYITSYIFLFCTHFSAEAYLW